MNDLDRYQRYEFIGRVYKRHVIALYFCVRGGKGYESQFRRFESDKVSFVSHFLTFGCAESDCRCIHICHGVNDRAGLEGVRMPSSAKLRLVTFHKGRRPSSLRVAGASRRAIDCVLHSACLAAWPMFDVERMASDTKIQSANLRW
jgi:hypothetical protein